MIEAEQLSGAGSLPGGSVTASRRNQVAKSTKVIVVLPAYNEEKGIGSLLERISEALNDEQLAFEVLVVDDGSQDRTLQIVEEYGTELPVKVSRHAVNQGLGATIRDGLSLASRGASPNDVVITMDADETHTPGLIVRMVRMIREGHDVVIASRYCPGARVFGVSRFRRFLSYGGSMLFRVAFPTSGVRDFTCGYRAYRGGVLRKALATYGDRFVDSDGFQCMVDILLKLRSMDVIFGEVPLLLRYDLKQGKSKMRIAKTVRDSIMLLVKRRFGSQH
jgi:dolichol-phosphate mannosyltransferase